MCGMSIKLDPDSDLCPFSLAATLLYYATSQAFDFQETPSLRKGTTLRFKVPATVLIIVNDKTNYFVLPP